MSCKEEKPDLFTEREGERERVLKGGKEGRGLFKGRLGNWKNAVSQNVVFTMETGNCYWSFG